MKQHAQVLLKKKKQWKNKAKVMNTWMKEDKEVLVGFYEEIIQEILQPNTTFIAKNMISSLSVRNGRVSVLTMSGPYDVCELDEDDYDSQQ